MKAFAELYARLDATTRTSDKVAALAAYFTRADPADAAWATWYLAGNRAKRLLPSARLRAWASEAAGLPLWLFEESYEAVGDLAETITLLLPVADASSPLPLAHWIEERLLPLGRLDEAAQREALLAAWRELDRPQLFLWNKLATGAFRVGVSAQLVLRALAQVGGLPEAVLAHRFMGGWRPTAAAFEALLAPETDETDVSRPYPFCLAHPLEAEPSELGPLTDWQAEWKWDGIRAQLIARRGQVFLWSRGEELVTERFPELADLGRLLPDGTVLDGEALAWRDGAPLGFAELQKRIGRKNLSARILTELPVVLVAYDLLEEGGEDLRARPLAERRARLEALRARLPGGDRLRLSPLVEAGDWDELVRLQGRAREQGAEGLMLKRRDSPYGVGRKRGDWWKWKVSPYTLDAVLVYAQRGHGRRASLYTDYTFALWDGEALVPFAKAYSGLTDEEILEVDRFVRRHTTERFGPVRAVEPQLVFELAFEGLQASKRHKSGIAVRFPRMLRWRRDKTAAEADTLATARGLVAG